MAIVVQKSADTLTNLVAGNEFYSSVAVGKIFPCNRYEEVIAAEGSATYINFTPSAAQDFQGVVLCLFGISGDGVTALNRVITVELEEDDGGWTNRLTKTIDTDDLIPDNTYSRVYGLFDLRFDSTYTLTTDPATWRLKIYHDGTGAGTFYLKRSENSGDDAIFHIIYSDTAATLTSSDVLVLTDKITLDDNLTLEKADADVGTQSDLNTTNRYWSIYGCIPNTTLGTIPQIYAPSTVAADYTLTIKGNIFVSSYETIILAGEDADNPIPAARTFTIDFNDVGSTNEAGFMAGNPQGAEYGKLAGIELWGTKPTYMWATLNANAAAGQANVKVDGDVTSEWSAGDYLEIGGGKYQVARNFRDYVYNEYDFIDSLSFAGGVTTITLDGNLTYNHYTHTDVEVYICNATRNIIVKGSDTTYTAESISWMNGGHIKAQGVYFEHLQTFLLYNNLKRSLSIAQLTSAKSVYDGCHFHDCYQVLYFNLDQAASEIKNCTSSNSLTGTTIRNYFAYIVNCVDFTFDSNKVNARQLYGVYTIGGYNITISNNHFNISYPLRFGARSDNFNISTNEFFRCRNGVWLNGCSNVSLDTNTFRQIYYDSNYAATVESQHGAYFHDGTNNIIFSEDDDFDECFAAVVGDLDSKGEHTLKNATLGGTLTDGAVSESGINYRPSWFPGSEIKFEDYDTTSGDCRSWFTYGYIVSTGTGLDDTESRTDGAGMKAWRFEQYNDHFDGIQPLELKLSAPVGVANEPITITVFCKVDSGNYDSGTYVAPTLTISGLGMTGAALTDAADTTDQNWQLLVASGTPTEVGQITITLSIETDASGANSYVYWDDMYISYKTPVDLGTLDHVYRALPVSPPISAVLTAQNVWSELVVDNQVAGSMGKVIKDLDDRPAEQGTDNAALAASFTFTDGNVHAVGMAVGVLTSGHFPNL